MLLKEAPVIIAALVSTGQHIAGAIAIAGDRRSPSSAMTTLKNTNTMYMAKLD